MGEYNLDPQPAALELTLLFRSRLNFQRPAWTSEQQNELALLLSQRTGTMSQVYKQFNQRVRMSTTSPSTGQHSDLRL